MGSGVGTGFAPMEEFDDLLDNRIKHSGDAGGGRPVCHLLEDANQKSAFALDFRIRPSPIGSFAAIRFVEQTKLRV